MQEISPATMSTAFLQPVFDELQRRGRSRAELASQLGIPEDTLSTLGIFERIFVEMANPGADGSGVLMIDATHLKAHRTASSLK